MSKQQRYVVMGGAGFLGSHLCERLVGEGHEVVAVDNFITGSASNVAHLAGTPLFSLVEADVSVSLPVEGQVDAVLNFASPASPVDYLEHPIETLHVGSLGTMNGLELARAQGARFIMASTSEVYGDPQIHPQTEDYWGHVNPVGPRSVYDEAKRFSEALVTGYRTTYGTDTGIVRIFNTFGPRMRPNDGRAIPNFVRQSLRGDPITIAGDGSQTRSICYVDDLVTGILALTRSSLAGPVNIGNPHEISMLELAQWIVKLVGSSSETVHIERPVDDPTVRRPDITLAQRELGWEPEVSADEGLRRTIEWFREHPEVTGL
ncbi:UDP-glucuronic acid decarboxylase family protein [Nocardioides sp. JQ2195]|uniref:UDP-glucuronic acid decarboxylase family protein n=1 Tax=Nocardioides sp. JQ2195 TaxID=2592334 RepID=UPI001F10B0C6|nr:UDP-glucuronic acid decarboxylase family protein [Nocardioides sp. JQ2195]